jgi:hypothetical protein
VRVLLHAPLGDSDMGRDDERRPGDRASVAGHYKEMNVFGSPTSRVDHVQEGKRLPAAPRGFTWRPVEDAAELAVLRAGQKGKKSRAVVARFSSSPGHA